jgi:type I restriction-modification system DNA methylase subunit
MDSSQYKDCVLVLLFVKYVSDKYAGQKKALIDVPKGGSFADIFGRPSKPAATRPAWSERLPRFCGMISSCRRYCG